jgi:hypothetical protein
VATYSLDFEGGNDANTGLSFAQRWKTITNGATAARIAPGDEIRIMASPDPTSLGNATWTGGGRPASLAGSPSSTNTTPIVVTLNGHGLVAGDYISLTGQAGNTNAIGVWKVGTTTVNTFEILNMDGSNTTGNAVGPASGGVTKVNNCMVKTASPLVQNIALCGGRGEKPAWTASANVTTAQATTNYKEGGAATQIAIAAGFTTGKAAYYTLPATLDLSAYQQVTFWVRLNSGTVGAAGQAYVALCTDTTGDTVVHQCDIPALGALNVWVPVTVNLGTNLNAAIQSVALYVVTDIAAQTFILDNIVACKAASSADSVTLNSLISKSDGTGDEAWYAIQSINSDVIMLANNNLYSSQAINLRGYNGITETVTSYKRETVKTGASASTSTSVSVINDSGTSGNLITYSGGWNRTDMSTQTGRTWLDGQNGNGRGLLVTSSQSFVTVDRLDFCRYTAGLTLSLSNYNNCSFPSIYLTANTGGIAFTSVSISTATTFGSVWANNNGNDSGIEFGGIGCSFTDIKLASNNSGNGLHLFRSRFVNVGSVIAGNNGALSSNSDLTFDNSMNCAVGTATLANGITSSGAIQGTASFNCFVNGGSSTGHSSGVFLSSSINPAEIYLNNFTINETLEVSTTLGSYGGFVYINRLDDTDNNSWVFQPGMGTVNQQTAVVDSPASTAWRMRPTDADYANAESPILLKLGTVVCAASSAVTVTARMQRSNTGLTMRLICPGGQITGVSNDVFTDMTAAINTWETVSITFTPTKAGAVDIYAHAFGGTTFSGYVCNLTATQV